MEVKLHGLDMSSLLKSPGSQNRADCFSKLLTMSGLGLSNFLVHV